MFKNIKNFILCFSNFIINAFRSFFCACRTVKKNHLLFYSLLTILMSASFIFSNLSFASLPGNKVDSIYNYISESKYNDIVGFSYVKTTYSGLGRTANYDSEDIKTVRDAIESAVIFEVYKPTPESDYSPAVINGENVAFMLLQQQHSYYGDPNNFIYPIPFLSGKVTSNMSSNTIFIHKEYADFYITNKNLTGYDDLLGCEIVISDSTHKESLYIVGGVLDSESKEYLHFKSYLGDFFILPEYFGMQASSMLYFELFNDNLKDLKLLRFIDKTFKYNSIFSANGGVIHEYRMSFFSLKEGWNGFYNNCLSFTNSVYDYYFYQAYIFGVLQYLVLLICSMVGVIFVLKLLCKEIKNTKSKIYALISSIILSITLGVLITALIRKINVLENGYLYLNYWMIGLINAVITIVFLVSIIFILKKPSKKNF